MGQKAAQILLTALMAGFRSLKLTAVTGNWKKALIVATLVSAVTAGDAIYSAATSTIDSAKVESFTKDCEAVEGNKVIYTVDSSKISILKLECAKDVGQDDTVIQDTGLANWIVANASLIFD